MTHLYHIGKQNTNTIKENEQQRHCNFYNELKYSKGKCKLVNALGEIKLQNDFTYEKLLQYTEMIAYSINLNIVTLVKPSCDICHNDPFRELIYQGVFVE